MRFLRELLLLLLFAYVDACRETVAVTELSERWQTVGLHTNSCILFDVRQQSVCFSVFVKRYRSKVHALLVYEGLVVRFFCFVSTAVRHNCCTALDGMTKMRPGATTNVAVGLLFRATTLVWKVHQVIHKILNLGYISIDNIRRMQRTRKRPVQVKPRSIVNTWFLHHTYACDQQGAVGYR